MQANKAGRAYLPSPADPQLTPTAMFSVALPNKRFSATQQAVFVKALQARLPGARVQVTQHTHYPPCSAHGRKLLADNATAAVAAMATEHRQAPTCAGSLVLNVKVTQADRTRLQALLQAVQRSPHTIWAARQVGRARSRRGMAACDGSASLASSFPASLSAALPALERRAGPEAPCSHPATSTPQACAHPRLLISCPHRPVPCLRSLAP